MRPYLAVIKDSFREAMATRVMWIMLGLTILLLAGLSPFGYEVALPSRLQFTDIGEPREFVKHLLENRDKEGSASSHLWKSIDGDTQKKLEALTEDTNRRERMRAVRELIGDVNDAVRKADFFDESVFGSVRDNREAAKLLDDGIDSLDEDHVARLNRLALDSAFDDFIEPAGSEAIQVYYLTFELGNPAPIPKETFEFFLNQGLSGFADFFVGVIGVFTAILVTSPIIPQMCEAGAIDLLLSKPVSRSFLFLSKFFGGCAFILLISAVLVTGLWAILGVQFDMWNSGLLWTIPVFVFVFAIYYTISCLAGVIWRNPVVSIVLAILFWLVCFLVGLTKGIMEQLVLNERRVAAIMPTSESLLVGKDNGSLAEWDRESSTWEQRYAHRGGGFGQPSIYPFRGPYYQTKEDRLVGTLDAPGAGFFTGSGKMVVASKDDDWKPKQTISTPMGMQSLMLDPDGTILVAGSRGLSRLKGDPGNEGDSVKVFGFNVPGLGTGPAFQPVRIDGELRWQRPVDAALNPATGDIAVRSGDVVTVLRKQKNLSYKVGATHTFEESQPGVIGYAGNRILFGGQDGQVTVFEDETLKVVSTLTPFGTHEPQAFSVSPNGQYLSLVSHSGDGWLFDGKKGEPVGASLRGDGQISAMMFASDGSLYVADGFGRVTQYDPSKSFEAKKTWDPSPDTVQTIYAWGVEPFYRIFPKPGEMGSIVYWLLTDSDTIRPGNLNDARVRRQKIDIWQPLWSNSIFMVVMLSITCLYLSRKDF